VAAHQGGLASRKADRIFRKVEQESLDRHRLDKPSGDQIGPAQVGTRGVRRNTCEGDSHWLAGRVSVSTEQDGQSVEVKIAQLSQEAVAVAFSSNGAIGDRVDIVLVRSAITPGRGSAAIRFAKAGE